MALRRRIYSKLDAAWSNAGPWTAGVKVTMCGRNSHHRTLAPGGFHCNVGCRCRLNCSLCTEALIYHADASRSCPPSSFTRRFVEVISTISVAVSKKGDEVSAAVWSPSSILQTARVGDVDVAFFPILRTVIMISLSRYRLATKLNSTRSTLLNVQLCCRFVAGYRQQSWTFNKVDRVEFNFAASVSGLRFIAVTFSSSFTTGSTWWLMTYVSSVYKLFIVALLFVFISGTPISILWGHVNSFVQVSSFRRALAQQCRRAISI